MIIIKNGKKRKIYKETENKNHSHLLLVLGVNLLPKTLRTDYLGIFSSSDKFSYLFFRD